MQDIAKIVLDFRHLFRKNHIVHVLKKKLIDRLSMLFLKILLSFKKHEITVRFVNFRVSTI